MNSFTTNLINLKDLKTSDCLANNKACSFRISALSAFLKTNPGRSVLGSLIVADNLVKGNNAAVIIDNLANDKVFTDYPDENLSNILQFVNIMSSSLRSKEDTRVWITKKEINDLLNDEITFKIYLGLLYATDQKNISNGHHIEVKVSSAGATTTISLKKIFESLAKNWSAESANFTSKFKEMAFVASNVSDDAQNIEATKKQGDQSSILVYADYASSVSTFLKLSLGFLQINTSTNPRIADLQNDVQKFIEVIDDAVNSCYDIKSQNYGALVLHTSSLLSSILESHFTFKDSYIKYGNFYGQYH